MTEQTEKVARKSSGQIIFLCGSSRGAKDGDRRTVSPERAKALVDAGLARYPASKE